MANFAELKDDIAAAIYPNETQEIDAVALRDTLYAMVDVLGAGFLFKGRASRTSADGGTTNPGSPDTNVAYVASQPGVYTNFGGLEVAVGEVALFTYDGTWTKVLSGAISTSAIADNLTTDDATKVLSAKQGKVLKDALDQIDTRDGQIFDIHKSTFDTSRFWMIEDIIIINGDPQEDYSLFQVSPTRASIKKGGVIIADGTDITDTGNNWHFLGGQNGATEIFYIKFDPANLSALINTGTQTAVIRSEKVVDAVPMDPERARANAARLFSSLENFAKYKNSLALLIDEIYIDGYTATDGLQIRLAQYANGRFDFRIQIGSDKIFTIDTDAPKDAYLLYNGDKYCFLRFNTAIIQSLNVVLSANASYAFADVVFNRAAHPFAYTLVSNHRKASRVICSGNILQAFPFSSPSLLNKDGAVYAETYESNGLGRIVYDAGLGKYIYEHRKFASRYNPSLNLKISTALREDFSDTDIIRVRGKVYASKGDSAYSGPSIPLTFYWEKEGKYPAASDVEQFHVYNPVPNETWTDFSVSGQIGEIGAWPYNAFRAAITIPTQDQYANNLVDKVIAVADLKIEIIKASFYADYNEIEIVDNSVAYPLPHIYTEVGKIDDAKVGTLAASFIRSICRMARVYFSKVKTLVSETEILYLNENFRTPTKGKSALFVEDGVLYFYDKNGNKKTINME